MLTRAGNAKIISSIKTNMASKRKFDSSADETDSIYNNNDKKIKTFRFTDDMISSLIECLYQYKVKCEYSNIDFDADKVMQYNIIRQEMAKRYSDHRDFFGPESIMEDSEELDIEEKNAIKEDKKLTAKGYRRILEKIKDIRQEFSKAVLRGTRSGSGKMIFPHYEKLKTIYAGSPNIEPMVDGLDSNSVNYVSSNDQDVFNQSVVQSDEHEVPVNYQHEAEPKENEFDTEIVEKENDTFLKKDHVARLIDEKRKHLERRLSASQRDTLLIKEAKEDRLERKELRDMLKSSNDSLTTALNNMSNAMLNISNTIIKTVENLSTPPPNTVLINPPTRSSIPFQSLCASTPQYQVNTNELFTSTAPNVSGADLFYQDMTEE